MRFDTELFGSYVFVSSSNDLHATRDRVARDLDSWSTSKGMLDVVRTFRWEEDAEKEHGLLNWRDIQSQLPDPGGEDVAFTLGLFGERCGWPLPASFFEGCSPAEMFPRWIARTYRPLYPWPDDPDEVKAALAEGCFPLTGTVYEVLRAIEAARAGGTGLADVLVAYIADADVTRTTEPDDIVFNHEALHDSLRLGPDGQKLSRRAADARLAAEYWPQIAMLVNFLKALILEEGVHVHRVASEGAMADLVAEKTRAFLSERLTLTSGRNPYKETLDYYGLDDPQELPGRRTLSVDVSRRVFAELRRGHGPRVRLTGNSGCGKSSFLRRGLLAQLRAEGKAGDHPCHVFVFRPTDPVLARYPTLTEGLWRAILAALSDIRVTEPFGGAEPKPRELGTRLTAALIEADRYLFIGTDQFEEWLDELHSAGTATARKDAITAMLDLLRALLDGGRTGLAVTLEDHRRGLLMQLPEGHWLRTEWQEVDLSLTRATAEAIVTEPFSREGLSLDRPVIEKIMESWEDLIKECGDRASTLPLLGLWLSEFFAAHRHWAIRRDRPGISDEINVPAGDFRLTREKIGDYDLSMRNKITELAENAWYTGTGVDPRLPGFKWDDQVSDLANFLNPFLGLTDDGQTMRLVSARRRRGFTSNDRLTEAFLSERLMVPIPGSQPEMIRLVHQSLIDQWTPAREWNESNLDYKKREFRVRLRDQIERMSPQAERPAATEAEIDDAAEVLANHLGYFGLDPSRDDSWGAVQSYTLRVFGQSRTPRALIASSKKATTHVHVAAAYDMADLLETFVELDPECLELKRLDERRPIHMAAWQAPNAVEFLLSRGVAVDIWDKEGWPPIAAPIQTGNRRIFDMLFSRFAKDPNAAITRHGMTLLHLAAIEGNEDVVEFLLCLDKIDPLKDDGSGDTALSFAVQRGRGGIIERLRSADEVRGNSRLLDIAAAWAEWPTVRRLLETEGLTDDDLRSLFRSKALHDQTPLASAARYANPSVVKRLLTEYGRFHDPSEPIHAGQSKGTLLHLAVSPVYTVRNSPRYELRLAEVLRILLDPRHGIDPNAKDAEGRTAYDLIPGSDLARDVFVDCERFERDWNALTDKDLDREINAKSVQPGIQLARNIPESLLAPLAEGGSTGLELLAKRGNHYAIQAFLATDVGQKQATDALLLPVANTGLFGDPRLVDVLGEFVQQRPGEFPETRRAVVAALIESETPLAEFWDNGIDVVSIRRDEALQRTRLHSLAELKDLAKFERVARRAIGELPLDGWGRRPSDLAPRDMRASFRTLEDKYFPTGDKT
ncbi:MULTISPECIES: ankyrin repeat domain-containing protein [Celeribacter]|uniref:nSTAND1 domain-containing NTPase n=1 Tax=Celeribacter TaxID=875170 RepID=UPI003A95B1C4